MAEPQGRGLELDSQNLLSDRGLFDGGLDRET